MFNPTGALMASGGAGDDATVCPLDGYPTAQPSVSPGPTVTASPTENPDPRPVVDVSSCDQLEGDINNMGPAIQDNTIVNVLNDLLCTEQIRIYQTSGLTIRSETGAKIISDGFTEDNGGLIRTVSSDIELVNLELVGGRATYGGCLLSLIHI